MSKTVKQQQMDSMRQFTAAVTAARAGDPVSPAEMRRFIDWYQDLMESVTCVNFILQGMLIPHFDENSDAPVCVITKKGYDSIEEGKPNNDGLN